MTDQKHSEQSSSTETVTEETERTGRAEDALSPEEEKAVRMHHGLTESDDRELKFGLGADDEVMAKLANLEKFLVEKFSQTEKLEGVFDDGRVDLDAKRKIIHTLKDKGE